MNVAVVVERGGPTRGRWLQEVNEARLDRDSTELRTRAAPQNERTSQEGLHDVDWTTLYFVDCGEGLVRSRHKTEEGQGGSTLENVES